MLGLWVRKERTGKKNALDTVGKFLLNIKHYNFNNSRRRGEKVFRGCDEIALVIITKQTNMIGNEFENSTKLELIKQIKS